MLDLQQIVRHHAFHHVAVAELQANPEPVHFRAGLETWTAPAPSGMLEIPHKSDGFDFGVRDGRDIALRREQFHTRRLQKGNGIHVTGQRFPVISPDDRLFRGGPGQM